MKIVELFAGMGGFRLGMGESHEYVYANDMNDCARAVYLDNLLVHFAYSRKP